MKKKDRGIRKSKEDSSNLEKDYELLKEKISGLITQENFLEDESNYQKVMDIVAENFPGNPQKKFSTITIDHFVKNFKTAAFLSFLYMKKSNDFGHMGKGRVLASFYRNIMKVPMDKAINEFDIYAFEKMIDCYDEKYGIKTADQYLTETGNYDLDFYGKEIDFASSKEIIPYLKFFKINIFLFITYAKLPMFILAKAEKVSINEYDLFILGKELIRSPYLVLSIVGKGGGVNIARKEACEVTFFNKWMTFFKSTTDERRNTLNHPDSAISEGLKKKALSLYNVYNLEDGLKIKSTFIDEMVDGIFWHELGHSMDKEMDPVLRNMLGSFPNSGSSIHVMNEIIADWAPERNGGKGAFARFLEIAQKDPQKAHRDIFVYLSDNWFVGDDEEYLPLLADVLTGLAVSFIEKDGSVNFNRIEKELNNIYQFAIESNTSIANKIMNILKTEKYTINDEKLNIKGINMDTDAMDNAIYEMYKGTKNEMPLEKLYFDGNIWADKIDFLQKYTRNGKKRLDALLEDSAQKLRMDVLNYVTKNHPEKYNNSLREYIYARYREIGVLVDPPMVDYKKTSNQIFKKMKLTQIEKEIVQKIIKLILSGIYCYIPEEDASSPFINFIQEILLKTNPTEMRGPVERGYLDDTTLKTIKIINLTLRPDDVMLAYNIDDFFLESIFLAYQNGYFTKF